MLLPTHALTGAVIGKNINNPWLVIIASIAVHFMMDSIRHGEYLYADHDKNTIKASAWKIAMEVLSAIFLIAGFLYVRHMDPQMRRNILLGSFFSVLPDFITFLYWLDKKTPNYINPILKKYYAFHSWVHRYPRNAPERAWTLRNARNDIIISLLAIAILFFF